MVSVAIEAKAGEGFDRTVGEWLSAAPVSSGKPARLEQLRRLLALPADRPADQLRYQLLHRAASAILEARRWGATAAMLLIQSFSTHPESETAFSAFGEQLGCNCGPGRIVCANRNLEIPLYLGWLQCDVADDSLAASAL